MASGTTILGMLPLLFDAMFGRHGGYDYGGLLVASALTLFVLPVAYCAIPENQRLIAFSYMKLEFIV